MKKLIIVFVLLSLCVVSFGQQIIEHTVIKGETLESIARRYGISTSDITSLNPSAAKFLYVGQKLQIKVVAAMPSSEELAATGNTISPVEQSEYIAVQPAQHSSAQIQYIAFKKPKLKLAAELGLMDCPAGSIYDYYNTFNSGQHYSIGAKLFLTDNLFTSIQFEYQWLLLSHYESGSKYTNYKSTTEDDFMNFIGVPLRIGYGGVNSTNAFGISGGFWLGGHVGTTVTTKFGDNKEKSNIKGSGFCWAPMVSLHWMFVTIQYRALFPKGSDDPIHIIGLSFSF